MRSAITNTLWTKLSAVVMLLAAIQALADNPLQSSLGTVTITGSVVD